MTKSVGIRQAGATACIVLALAATLAACSGTSGPHGTVTGRLLRVGGPAPGAPFPLPGQVTATSTAAGGSAVSASVGNDGKYSLDLAPGTYRLTGTSPLMQSGKMTCIAQAPAHVTAGHTTAGVDVICSIP